MGYTLVTNFNLPPCRKGGAVWTPTLVFSRITRAKPNGSPTSLWNPCFNKFDTGTEHAAQTLIIFLLIIEQQIRDLRFAADIDHVTLDSTLSE